MCKSVKFCIHKKSFLDNVSQLIEKPLPLPLYYEPTNIWLDNKDVKKSLEAKNTIIDSMSHHHRRLQLQQTRYGEIR